MRTITTRDLRITSAAVALGLLLFVVGSVSTHGVAHAQCGIGIRPESAVDGVISGSSTACDYTFQGDLDDAVTIEMLKTDNRSSLDPIIRLFDPNGALILFDDDSAGGGNSRICRYYLPATGMYTIRAASYTDSGYGPFTLRLSAAGKRCGGPIEPNTRSWTTGQISSNETWCEYTFDGTAGDTVSIAMTGSGSGSVDSWLDLRDPNCAIVASDDDSYGGRNSLIDHFVLQSTGPYTILAHSYGYKGTGRFKVALIKE